MKDSFSRTNSFLFVMLLLACAGVANVRAAPATTNTDSHATARALGAAFADISQKVSPAVVVINVWYPDDPQEGSQGDGSDGAPFEFFFPQPRGSPRHPQGGGGGGGSRTADPTRPDSQGSGFIV